MKFCEVKKKNRSKKIRKIIFFLKNPSMNNALVHFRVLLFIVLWQYKRYLLLVENGEDFLNKRSASNKRPLWRSQNLIIALIE